MKSQLDIINYVQETPLNTNSSVLTALLSDLSPLTELDKFTYLIDCKNLNYAAAYEYFIKNNPSIEGGCSCMVIDGKVGRNFDWNYTNQPIFIVKVPAQNGKYSSIGVANINNTSIYNPNEWSVSDVYNLIPFFTTDGINEKGLFCGTLVVPNDYGNNISIPTLEKRDSINGIMLVRYILDNFDSVSAAVDYITKYVEIWFSKFLHDINYEQHYILADKDTSVCLEIINNQIVITEAAAATNFYLSGVTFNDDGSVYTPASDGDPMEDNGITKYGSGLERYNYLVDFINNHETCTTSELQNAMKDLFYTRAYNTSVNPSDPYWYTEFVGNNIYCNSSVDEFSSIVAAAGQEYLKRTRESGTTWQTVHSAVYNLNDLSLSIIFQENNNIYNYNANIGW